MRFPFRVKLIVGIGLSLLQGKIAKLLYQLYIAPGSDQNGPSRAIRSYAAPKRPGKWDSGEE